MTGSTNDPDVLRAEIAQARSELADTVDQLAVKLDVKQQARQRMDDTKATALQRLQQARDSAPQPVVQALDRLSDTVLPVLGQAVRRVRENPRQVLVAASVAVMITLIGRRAGGTR